MPACSPFRDTPAGSATSPWTTWTRTLKKIVEAGGKLLRPAADVPGMLRFAVMADPQGAAITVFTPNPAMPSPERPQSPTPGTVGWHELSTSDP